VPYSGNKDGAIPGDGSPGRSAAAHTDIAGKRKRLTDAAGNVFNDNFPEKINRKPANPSVAGWFFST